MSGIFYIIGTPIGNMEDITLRLAAAVHGINLDDLLGYPRHDEAFQQIRYKKASCKLS